MLKPFKIYRFCLNVRGYGPKEGLLLESPHGAWAEVSPLPSRNRETLLDALAQLKAVQKGYTRPLFPSVACGLFGLTAPRILQAPVCLFLMGTLQDIQTLANQDFGCKTAKVKISPFDLPTAVNLIKTLKNRFRLRIDIGAKWTKEKTFAFLSHFSPEDFDFIEDPGYDISPFPMASDDQPLGKTIVWKPMVRGLPPPQTPVILSSTYESSIGLHQIAALSQALQIPSHPLGIGTFLNLEEDLLEEPLTLQHGLLHFPKDFRINRKRLQPC